MEQFREAVREAILHLPSPQYEAISKEVESLLDTLYEEGHVHLPHDYRLGGHHLEIRVKHLFEQMGFVTNWGRKGYEDLVIPVPAGFTPPVPLVVEVKSGRSASPDRDHVRQLDDWVFELSGEDKVRKGELSAPGRMITQGLGSTPVRHPTPHKGVLVWNGPVNERFEHRSADWLSKDIMEFAFKRDFCIISLPSLMAHVDRCQSVPAYPAEFWQQVHAAAGVLNPPTASGDEARS